MNFHINLGQWNSIFAVPTSVIDSHLKLAGEAQLKTLLYILRHAGEELSAESVSADIGLSVDAVSDSVDFWTERGLLSSYGGELIPAQAVEVTSSASAQASPSDLTDTKDINTNDEPAKKPHTTVSRAVRPDSAFVSELISRDTNLAGLMEEAQTVMKKPLSPGDTATLVMLYNTFGLPCEVIALLLNYIASNGNPNMRAVERYGISWSDNGIFTVEAAEREIARMTASREAWSSAARIMGISTAGRPTSAQLANADRWLNTWGFNEEMILEAYERCVNKKNEFNMSYMNGILKKWYEKKLFSLDALKEYEESSVQKKPVSSKRKKESVFSVEGGSFEISDFDKRSLFDD